MNNRKKGRISEQELSSQLSLGELDEAQILLTLNFERAAGVVTRVALEGFIKVKFQIELGTYPIPKFDQCIIGLKKTNLCIYYFK